MAPACSSSPDFLSQLFENGTLLPCHAAAPPPPQVLSLYRSVLRAARQHPASRTDVQAYARHSIEAHRGLSRSREVMRIEHLLRKGAKQLAALTSPEFAGFKWQQPP
jgi:hypothetical protein